MKTDRELIAYIQEHSSEVLSFMIGRDEFVVLPREKFEQLLTAAETWANALERTKQLTSTFTRSGILLRSR